MPHLYKLSKSRRYDLLRWLDKKYQELNNKHYLMAPTNGCIPVGGGDWMDLFFKMEALRGMMGGLRSGKSVTASVNDGKAVSEIAIKIWNTKREWQVKRWEKSAHTFLESVIRQWNLTSN